MTREHNQIFAAIRDAIALGVRNFLAAFNRDWVNETMYGFLLIVDWEGTMVEAVAGTEEGLLRTAHRYAARQGREYEESISCLRTSLRWGSPEDGWYDNYNAGFFDEANQLIAKAHESGLIELGDQQLQHLCLEVLQDLDAAELFVNHKTREKLVIGLSDVGGDHAEEDFLRWAEIVNPSVVIDRLRRELQEGAEACLRSLQLRFGEIPKLS